MFRFQLHFDALNANVEPNEPNETIANMFSVSQRLGILRLPILQPWLPPLRVAPTDHAHSIEVTRHRNGTHREEVLSLYLLPTVFRFYPVDFCNERHQQTKPEPWMVSRDSVLHRPL
ncbi:hypothetical protein JVT61DRAFT_8127 [Boletus reticuloceps]|uniref:Uncharacterized protein n=1 Tax=Boletus reticuloceps TaxID=495285 RepID=A0A8I2Z0I7_9AGAM|nr:hypothetical protein JVT61DRAFT_8127 [Boletus reticuloceps]